MKTRFIIPMLFAILCCNAIAPAAFGQVIYWIGSSGADFGYDTNWSGDNGVGGTTPISETICTFDGGVPGNLTLYTANGVNGTGIAMGADFVPDGISFDLTPGQTGSVTLTCDTNSAQAVVMGFNSFRVQAGAGPLILGDGSSHQFTATLRSSSNLFPWINFGSNPVVINPNFQIFNGGAYSGKVINFQGTGDFAITNNLRFNGSTPAEDLQWDNTGTTIWAAGGINNKFNSLLGNVIINAGTVIVESSGLLPWQPGATTTINSGTLIVNGTNSASSVTVNGGTLGSIGVLGSTTIQNGGTLAPGETIGTLTINSNLNIGGNVAIEVWDGSPFSPKSFDRVVVTGTLTNTGTGMITVSDLGSALRTGDEFTLFNKPLQNGGAMTVTGAGVSWINNLEVDGSIIVNLPILKYTDLGASLQFSWGGSFKLQSQTNDISTGLGSNWSDYPGGDSSGIIVPINSINGTVFFRLVSP
jgi:hypothetical protein